MPEDDVDANAVALLSVHIAAEETARHIDKTAAIDFFSISYPP
jgi:hypothetical protein